MILRRVVREKVFSYFTGVEWNNGLSILTKGRDHAYHAHFYAEGILHPRDVADLVKVYFESRQRPLEREIGLLTQGTGLSDVYYIQPEGICHFEILLRFSDDTVIEPRFAAKSPRKAAF